MATPIDLELVNSPNEVDLVGSDKLFCDDEVNDGKTDDNSERSTVSSGHSSILQSTPVNGAPPTRESDLPSAIKSAREAASRVINAQPSKIQQRKSIFSRLSSIAEKSFNSPRRTKHSHPKIEEESDVNADSGDENNNTMGSVGNLTRSQTDESAKLREAKCECNSCKDAFALDTFSDRTSVISCSLASLPTSPPITRDSFERVPIIEDHEERTESLFEEGSAGEKNTRISDGVQRLSKFLHTTVKAGRKSLSRSSNRTGFNSEDSSTTVGARSVRTYHGDESKSYRENAFLSRCLKKLASAVSMHNYGVETRGTKTDGDLRGHDSMSLSTSSLMFVLLSQKPGDAEIDQLIWGENNGSNGPLTRDPALRRVLEELRDIMLSQEVVVKQASKALDECSNLVRKQSDGIIFAEQLLNVASQSYFLAERELHRLLEGGVFEPQRDRVVLKKIKFELPEFKSPAPESYYLVLLKSGHRIKSSDIFCVTPGEQWLTIERWNRLTDDGSQPTECMFEFNRPDWNIQIEVYFVCKQRRESFVSFDRLTRFMDARGPPSRRIGSNRSVEVRKSSFGLLGQATFSKEDILNKRKISLTDSQGYGPFKSQIFIDGRAFLHPNVYYEAYLIVKDFNGLFGSKGQMRTFSARLSNQRLDFFERYAASDEKQAGPKHTIVLHDVSEDSVVVTEEDSTYFYDFTLKLSEVKETWLHLCTNSREDTDLWVNHLRKALREPCGIDLQCLSSSSPSSSSDEKLTETDSHAE